MNNFSDLSASVFSWLEERCKPQLLQEAMYDVLSEVRQTYQTLDPALDSSQPQPQPLHHHHHHHHSHHLPHQQQQDQERRRQHLREQEVLAHMKLQQQQQELHNHHPDKRS